MVTGPTVVVLLPRPSLKRDLNILAKTKEARERTLDDTSRCALPSGVVNSRAMSTSETMVVRIISPGILTVVYIEDIEACILCSGRSCDYVQKRGVAISASYSVTYPLLECGVGNFNRLIVSFTARTITKSNCQ